MKISGKEMRLSAIICLIAYYGFAYWLPSSYSRLGGGIARKLRTFLCKRIFKRCGKNVNIERKACFGSGLEIEIGDESGLGINCTVPSNTIIGNYVMMGPNCFILSENHKFDRLDIPMCKQGMTLKLQTIIEDDVWIGRDVLMTPGRNIKRGSIIGAGCLLCKDFPEYSIIGGNPSKLIRNRKEQTE